MQTVRTECLDRLLILNEHHLRHVLTRHLVHYHTARPHRGLDLNTPTGTAPPPPDKVVPLGRIHRTDILGGLLHEYRRAA